MHIIYYYVMPYFKPVSDKRLLYFKHLRARPIKVFVGTVGIAITHYIV